MKKIILLISFISSAIIFAQNPNLGASGAQFLEIPADARSSALGGAYVGLVNDVSAVFWNPAGTAKIKSNSVKFSYMRWFDLFDYNSIAAGFNFDGIGVFSVSAIIFSMDKMEITTENNPNGSGRFFDSQDLAIGLSYSRFLTDKFSFGITAKYVQQRIWNESSSGLAFDIGTQYKLDWQNLTIAMSMKNFGADLQFDGEDLNVTYDKEQNIPKNRLTPARLLTEEYPLPLSFQVGFALDIIQTDFFSMITEIDAVHPNDNKERINIGTELAFYNRIFLRSGYRYNYDDEGLTLGVGANLPFSQSRVAFDYSYSVYDLLPNVHRITVGLDF